MLKTQAIPPIVARTRTTVAFVAAGVAALTIAVWAGMTVMRQGHPSSGANVSKTTAAASLMHHRDDPLSSMRTGEMLHGCIECPLPLEWGYRGAL